MPDISRALWGLGVGLVLVLASLTGPAPARGTSDPVPPLRTNGNQIVDATGRAVVLQGVNWFGLETATHSPHGLWTRDYREMLGQIKSLGFNVIRLPFSLQALRSQTASGIDYGGGRNRDLLGKTPQQIMDLVIDEAAAQGLMVILDNHSQTDDGYMFDLWYGQGGFTEDDWVTTWTALAQRYRSKPNVIGFDLKNEPHGSATWGTGGATDWRRAAERAGNAVLAANPDLLILVEGIDGPVAGGQQLERHWWGGNLEGVRNNPVRLNVANRVVYSPHEYGPGVYDQPWFSDAAMTTVLADRWEKGFGYISDSGTAPILVGEFGAKNVGTDTVEGRWIRQFADYMGRTATSWTFWSWNPNSGDTGGVLTDDWRTVHPAKVALLTALMHREPIDYGAGSPTATPSPTATSTPPVTPTPTPTAPTPTGTPPTPTGTPPTPTAPTPTGTPPPGSVIASVVTDSSWTSGWCGRLSVTNRSVSRVVVDRFTATLPQSATITSSWNGTFTRSGSSLSVQFPSWVRTDPGATYADTGLCVAGSAPTDPAVMFHSETGTPAPTDPAPQPPPTPAPTASPTPTPTPGPGAPGTPVVTATPTTAVVTARWRNDSDWPTGFCRSVVVTNSGPSDTQTWRMAFTLPTAYAVTQFWNGSVTRSGTTVTVVPTPWGSGIPAGGSRNDFGFCATK